MLLWLNASDNYLTDHKPFIYSNPSLAGDAGVAIVCRAVRMDYNDDGPAATGPTRST